MWMILLVLIMLILSLVAWVDASISWLTTSYCIQNRCRSFYTAVPQFPLQKWILDCRRPLLHLPAHDSRIIPRRFLLIRNISNFALSRIADEIANIHWVPVANLLSLLFEVLNHCRVRIGGRIWLWWKQLRFVSGFTSMVQDTTAIC